MPQTIEISSAVGIMWNTMDVRTKLIPFVPLSMARVRPPVCLDRWKFRSNRRRCSKILQATRRIAFCATFAKTALRSSWESAAPIRVVASVRKEKRLQHSVTFRKAGVRPTGYDHRAAYCPCCAAKRCEVHVQRVYDALEIERDLDVQDLLNIYVRHI